MAPPKKKGEKPTKSERKEKEKVFEDRTFGLKNKNKSSKVQKYMKSLRTQIHGGGKKGTAVDPAEARRLKKEAEKAKQQEMLMLFRVTLNAADESNEREPEAAGADEDDVPLSVEEIIESERARLYEGTTATKEAVFSLLERVRNVRKEKKESRRSQREASKRGPSGKELWLKEATLFVDDEDAYDIYEREKDDEEDAEGNEKFSSRLPHTWEPGSWVDKGRPPKSLLIEWLQRHKKPAPVFSRFESDNSFQATVKLWNDREFSTAETWPAAKQAENAVALSALHYIYVGEESGSVPE